MLVTLFLQREVLHGWTYKLCLYLPFYIEDWGSRFPQNVNYLPGYVTWHCKSLETKNGVFWVVTPWKPQILQVLKRYAAIRTFSLSTNLIEKTGCNDDLLVLRWMLDSSLNELRWPYFLPRVDTASLSNWCVNYWSTLRFEIWGSWRLLPSGVWCWQCGFVGSYQHFRKTCCFHPHCTLNNIIK
jgi:hypothetical protein